MFPLSHTVVAMALNRALWHDRRPAPAICGALIPDAVDKPMSWAFGWTGSSHHLGHSALAAVIAWQLTALAFGRETARSVFSAYVSHLICDELHHGRVPWLLPLSDARRRPAAERHSPLFLALELPAAIVLYLTLSAHSAEDALA